MDDAADLFKSIKRRAGCQDTSLYPRAGAGFLHRKRGAVSPVCAESASHFDRTVSWQWGTPAASLRTAGKYRYSRVYQPGAGRRPRRKHPYPVRQLLFFFRRQPGTLSADGLRKRRSDCKAAAVFFACDAVSPVRSAYGCFCTVMDIFCHYHEARTGTQPHLGKNVRPAAGTGMERG